MALSSHPDSSIGILTHPRFPKIKELRADISHELGQQGIPHLAPRKPQERAGNVVERPYVIVDSWNALKGVEFDAVIIVGVDCAVEQAGDTDANFEEMAGLYTAMTRTKDHLVMLYDNKTSVVDKIQAVLDAPEKLSYEGK